MTTERRSLPDARWAIVDMERTTALKFKVSDVVAAFPNEWQEWQDDDAGTVEEFVSEMVAEIGLDLLDYDWCIPEPMHDNFESSVRFRDDTGQ